MCGVTKFTNLRIFKSIDARVRIYQDHVQDTSIYHKLAFTIGSLFGVVLNKNIPNLQHRIFTY